MRRAAASGPIATRRAGKYMILLALLLPVLIGMMGLTIDAGMLLAARRQAQNVADAAALAGADDLLASRLRGSTSDTARTSALATVREYVTANTLPTDGRLEANIPPVVSPSYAGNDHFVEVIVT